MAKQIYDEFLNSEDTLWVYKNDKLVFSSKNRKLLALLDYIKGPATSFCGVTILDKVTGNAAALLSIKAGCQKVYSPLGSQLAIDTLEKYDIEYHIDNVVPYICQEGRVEMCPMEKLSIDKDPEEFYVAMLLLIKMKGQDIA